MKLPLENISVTAEKGYALNKSSGVTRNYNYSISSTTCGSNSFKEVESGERCFYSNEQTLPFEECSATIQNPEITEPITTYTSVVLMTSEGLTRYEVSDGYILRTYLESGNQETIATCVDAFWIDVDRSARYDPSLDVYEGSVTIYGLKSSKEKWYLSGGFDCVSSPETIIVDSYSIGTFTGTKYSVSQSITE